MVRMASNGRILLREFKALVEPPTNQRTRNAAKMYLPIRVKVLDSWNRLEGIICSIWAEVNEYQIGR